MDTSHDDLYEYIQASLDNRATESFNGKTKGNLTYIYQLLYTKTMTLSTMFKQQ
jgi:hypothetical protein